MYGLFASLDQQHHAAKTVPDRRIGRTPQIVLVGMADA